jgi:hypothetical protein
MKLYIYSLVTIICLNTLLAADSKPPKLVTIKDKPILGKMGSIVFSDDFKSTQPKKGWIEPKDTTGGMIKNENNVMLIKCLNSEMTQTNLSLPTKNQDYTCSFYVSMINCNHCGVGFSSGPGTGFQIAFFHESKKIGIYDSSVKGNIFSTQVKYTKDTFQKVRIDKKNDELLVQVNGNIVLREKAPIFGKPAKFLVWAVHDGSCYISNFELAELN